MENQVPWLRSGIGKTPADGGCIMQVVDWIHREMWTDAPPCVHPAIRSLAIYLNDKLPDDERQKLLDLAPRMMGTASDDPQLSVDLAAFCAERVLHIFEDAFPNDDRLRKAIEAAKSGDAGAAEAAEAAWAAEAAARAARAAGAAEAAWAAEAAARAARAAGAAEAAEAAWAAAGAARAAAEAGIDLLVALLDKHDRLTGRTETEELDFAPVICVMAGA